jgi:nitroimidazol reductase NimA-like FMN-containing flavoprotein (pyridoxamine 5'-phosphate oxidase superfamily)
MTEPLADRPHVPGYGVPESVDGILPWSWARERLERAIVYWLATTGADGAPHIIPIWGAWVGDRWYVEGGPTRWQRNLRENPRWRSTSRSVTRS